MTLHSNVLKVPVVRLGDVCSFKSGNSLPDGQEFLEQEHGFLLLKVSDLNRTENIPVIRTAGLWSQIPVMESTSCKPGAIILPKRGGAIATNKKRILGRPAALDPNLMGVEPDTSRIDSLYLYYWFQQFDLTKITSGSAVPQLNKQDLFPLKIPLPTLEEQRRIAAILDKADAVRRKRKEAIALTEELLRSAFLKMFGDPATNPKGWVVMPMHEVIQDIEAGWSANGEERRCENDEWGVLKISAVTSGRFQANEHKVVEEPSFKKPPIIPQRGDLLFSRANTRELVAATCLVEKDYERLFLPDKLWRIKPDPKVANAEYLRFLLSDTKYRSLLAGKATGTSGSMLNVSQAKLLEMNAPIPQLDIQQRFAEVVWQTFKMRERYELGSTKTDSIFNSLLQRAFRGEL